MRVRVGGFVLGSAMPGYLLVSAFHKQAFASATRHQLLAFLQVAAFTNRTAVLPFADPEVVECLDADLDCCGRACAYLCDRGVRPVVKFFAPLPGDVRDITLLTHY